MIIRNESEFLSAIVEIDSDLKRNGISISARPIQACIKLSNMLGQPLPLVGAPTPGNYEGASLVGHLHRWFDDRYGDRLKVDVSPAFFPVAIRGDLFLAKLPMIYGEALLVIEREYTPKERRRIPQQINLLDFIKDLTPSFRNTLSDEECNYISDSCFNGLNQSKQWDIAGRDFRLEISADIRASAIYAVEGNFGFSRWHSLSASEKALKYFVRAHAETPPYTHQLVDLNRRATKLGMRPIDKAIIAIAYCKGDVRYERKLSTARSAYEANQASRIICTHVASALPAKG